MLWACLVNHELCCLAYDPSVHDKTMAVPILRIRADAVLMYSYQYLLKVQRYHKPIQIMWKPCNNSKGNVSFTLKFYFCGHFYYWFIVFTPHGSLLISCLPPASISERILPFVPGRSLPSADRYLFHIPSLRCQTQWWTGGMNSPWMSDSPLPSWS